MKKHEAGNFWIGFIVATLATLWFYWFWRRKREVMPEPMIIRRIGEERKRPALTQETRPESSEQPPGEVEQQDRPDKKDSLEIINGIGPTYVKRLNGAGIYAFEQLARTPVEKLREITHVTRWDPAEWIEEAEQLSSS